MKLALIIVLASCADPRVLSERCDDCAVTVHAPGILDPSSPSFHVTLLKQTNWDFARCASCHGADFSGGTSGVSCLSCHAAGPTACVTCHGSGPSSNAHPVHAGATVAWDARVTQEEKDRFIAWTSEPGADVPNSGRVEFRDAGERGTVVTATIAYDPPGGVIGKVIAKLFQREPAIQARRDLRRFKQLMETGEIATPAMNPKQFEEMGL